MLKFLQRLFLPTKLDTEIKRVSKALERYQYELEEIDSNFNATDHCCQDCLTGGRHSNLQDKIERIILQLEILKVKRDSK